MLIDQLLHQYSFGTRLVQHCEASLFQHYDALPLESFADNHQVNNFYHKNG